MIVCKQRIPLLNKDETAGKSDFQLLPNRVQDRNRRIRGLSSLENGIDYFKVIVRNELAVFCGLFLSYHGLPIIELCDR